jgi:hypothetical protein
VDTRSWKRLTRQRRWWPPDASFVLVIALSIVLGVWPLADPQWTQKGAYLLVVIAMLIVGSLISARDRWRLERRYAADFGAQLMGVRAKVFTLEKNLTGIVQDYNRALESGSNTPDIDGAYFNCLDELGGVLSTLVHFEILMSSSLIAAMDKQPMTIDDIKVIMEELTNMNTRLGELYGKTLLGD